MKVALYIDDGREQIVLTPETDSEKSILARFHDGTRVSTIYKGAFYECRGGWVRQGADKDSTIIALRPQDSGADR